MPDSERKQNEMPEFEAEKVLLHSHARRQVAHVLEDPDSLKAFRKVLFKRRVELRLQCL